MKVYLEELDYRKGTVIDIPHLAMQKQRSISTPVCMICNASRLQGEAEMEKERLRAIKLKKVQAVWAKQVKTDLARERKRLAKKAAEWISLDKIEEEYSRTHMRKTDKKTGKQIRVSL